GGYDAGLLDQHLWSGVATGIGAFACVLVRSFAKVRPDRTVLQPLATALVVGTCGTMIVAAHFGGSLTHGEGYLTDYAPAPIRLLAGLPIPRDRSRERLTPVAEREAFDGVALRIFENHCTACHNPGKLKGNLKLDTYEGVLAGGQSGPVVLAGNPGSSELLKRVHLPLEDKAHMPPKGKTPLTDDEMAVLAWWIEAGVPKSGTLKARNAPGRIGAGSHATPREGERRGGEDPKNPQASEYEARPRGLRARVPESPRP